MTRSMKRLFYFSLLTLACGCSSTLETGYEPKRLDMPLSQRETLYADPYSQQVLNAKQDQQSDSGAADSSARRPGAP
jgi:hypothetical protein